MSINLSKFSEIAHALQPAHRGDQKHFHVAGIYRKNRLVSLACNKNVTHPATLKYDYWEGSHAHAELRACLRGGLESYRGYTMIVCRIGKDGRLNNSKPCKGCADLIKQLDFDKVIYTNEIGGWVENGEV